LIANIEVTDVKEFEEYRQKVAPLIAQFGGRHIVRGGDVRRLEGSLPIRRPAGCRQVSQARCAVVDDRSML
jgi:uncharacterized protein (DUF1330 family)